MEEAFGTVHAGPQNALILAQIIFEVATHMGPGSSEAVSGERGCIGGGGSSLCAGVASTKHAAAMVIVNAKRVMVFRLVAQG
jgi:hypothetical protein